VSREAHAGFCERRRVKLPPPTLLVVMVAGPHAHARALRDEVAGVLGTMGLRLSDAKTRVCHIDEGVDFLGWRIQRHQQRGSTRR
jgi:RNA-directed DNA polymerase